jgi:Tfp pilus assembly protein PilF
MEIAKVFWQEKKFEKARKFFKQAVVLDKDNGDTWGFLALFEQENG